MQSPYINTLSRQFIITALTKLTSRARTSDAQKERVIHILQGFSTSTELEIQQRAIEGVSLFRLGDLRVGVLEEMPPPELKTTVMGTGLSSPLERAHTEMNHVVQCRKSGKSALREQETWLI